MRTNLVSGSLNHCMFSTVKSSLSKLWTLLRVRSPTQYHYISAAERKYSDIHHLICSFYTNLFITAGDIAWSVQSVAIAELTQQSHGRNTSIGDSSTCEYLPAGHSKTSTIMKYTKINSDLNAPLPTGHVCIPHSC